MTEMHAADAQSNEQTSAPRRPARQPSEAAARAAAARQAVLTKPAGSLGRLESVAIRLAAQQACDKPSVERVHIAVFAADHGVAAEGVSAYPQAVTVEMIRNFARGGAAVSVLARSLGATLQIVNLGTATPMGPLPGVASHPVGHGTANIAREAAMTPQQLEEALEWGRDSAAAAQARGAQLFIGGEMGIGNTTAAAALACTLLRQPPGALVGPGTGLDAGGVARKAAVIEQALALHDRHADDPFEALRRLGGFEIAALAGAYIGCAQNGLPVLVDGFIAGAAALAASRLCPGLGQWLFFAHRSAEPGHALVLAALQAEPLLDLGLRLGEGSGAALAVPLLRLACALHAGMATFAEAGVSGKV
jgi:nicotinate-nucleotide--dimethylbenzimidazole phosphoribosyltransferase